MSDMLTKMREVFEQHNLDTSVLDGESIEEVAEGKETIGPLEEALYRALYSLEEIRLYANYGRTQECGREASDCLDKLTELTTKWIDQNKMLEALTSPPENTMGGYS